jgi:hypothetical protein
MQQGQVCSVSRGLVCPAETDARGGVNFQGTPGTVLKTGRQAVKTNVWVPAGLLRRPAAEMLDGLDVDALISMRVSTLQAQRGPVCAG